jgi:hypothetical protein
MFTFNGRDAHRALAPAKIHLPFKRQIGDILPEKTKTDDDVVCEIVSLPFASHVPSGRSCSSSPSRAWSSWNVGEGVFLAYTTCL